MSSVLLALSLALCGPDVARLGDDDFFVREAAQRRLEWLRPLSLPAARKALTDPDAEVRKRADVILRRDPVTYWLTTAYIQAVVENPPAWDKVEAFINWIDADGVRYECLVDYARRSGMIGPDENFYDDPYTSPAYVAVNYVLYIASNRRSHAN